MRTLNIFLSFALSRKPPSRMTSQNLRDFQEKCLLWSSVIVKPLSLGFTVILLMTEAVVRRCSSKQIFLKTFLQTCNFIKKTLQYRCSPVKFAKFLTTPFLWNTSSGYFCYDSETYDMVKLYLSLEFSFLSI